MEREGFRGQEDSLSSSSTLVDLQSGVGGVTHTVAHVTDDSSQLRSHVVVDLETSSSKGVEGTTGTFDANTVQSPENADERSAENGKETKTSVPKNSTPQAEVSTGEVRQTPTETKESTAKNTGSLDVKNKPEKIGGWLGEYPFYLKSGHPELLDEKNWVYSSDLTRKERWTYRKEFLREYISETRKCLPYRKR